MKMFLFFIFFVFLYYHFINSNSFKKERADLLYTYLYYVYKKYQSVFVLCFLGKKYISIFIQYF